MPQKKNPDSLELLRGKAGRIFGNVCYVCVFASMDVTMHMTPDGWVLDDAQRFAVDVQQGLARGQGTAL